MDVRLPNLGDGVDSATVLSILVSKGDKVEKDQNILELETDKAVAPIPSSESGVVEEILVKEGDKVSTGTAVLRISASGNGAKEPQKPADAPKQAPAQAREPERRPQPSAAPTEIPGQISYQYVSQSGSPPPASPALRVTARQLGIDLGRVKGSGNGGRITTEDVKNYIQYLQATVFQGQAAPKTAEAAPVKPERTPLPDFSKWGEVERKKASSLRQTIGRRMHEIWNTVPHVTQFEEADITDVMALRKKYNPAYEKKNARLTVTVFVLKAVVDVLKKYPQVNASYDEATGEMIYKKYYHIGVAVDTEAGLIVPVIRDVDKKSLLELSQELSEVAEKARQRKVSREELQGATFTISNLGSLGVGAFSPIVNHPEVAILGLGRGVKKPVYMGKDDTLQARLIMPVSLSYDHRVIDGADGARFVRDLVDALQGFNEDLLKVKES